MRNYTLLQLIDFVTTVITTGETPGWQYIVSNDENYPEDCRTTLCFAMLHHASDKTYIDARTQILTHPARFTFIKYRIDDFPVEQGATVTVCVYSKDAP